MPEENACAPGEGLRALSGDALPPFPFQPGDLIDAGTLDLLRDYLPGEIWEHRERFFFEGMQLEVGPCFRDYAPPAFYDEATRVNGGKARLLENGGLEGHGAGLPFAPDTLDAEDPRLGLRWAWNVQSRYKAAGMRGPFRISDLIGRIGVAEPFEGEIFQYQLAMRADRPDDGYLEPNAKSRLWVAGGRYFTPFRAREWAWLQYRDRATLSESRRSDDLHIYIPELRRVRRAPAQGVEGLFVPSFGVGVEVGGSSPAVGLGGMGALDPGTMPDQIHPKRSGFEVLELRPILYEYRVLGVQDLLAPINAGKPAYPEDELRTFGPYGLSWASDRWDVRRSLAIEGVLREALKEEGAVSRMRLWVDLQTLHPLYYVSYDAKGELIDVGYFVGRWSEDRPDYPRWPDDPDRPVRVIDSVGAGFANLRLKGSWRRESWTLVSVPENEKAVQRALSIRMIQGGR